MQDELTISAVVTAPPGATLTYRWRAPMLAKRPYGTAQFWRLCDTAGNDIGSDYEGSVVMFPAGVWDEYAGHVQLTVGQYDESGFYTGSASGTCEISVDVCGNEVPATIEVVTRESNGLYAAYPRVAFIWSKVPGATGYLVGIHPNKDSAEYGRGTTHGANLSRVITTNGTIADTGSDQAGYVLEAGATSAWDDEPPDMSAYANILDSYRQQYGSYTVAVQVLYD
jgi:hypothetical protein